MQRNDRLHDGDRMSDVVASAGELLRELAVWETSHSAAAFPYESLMNCYRARGKHFVDESVLETLASLRAKLTPTRAGDPARNTLDRFLEIALDKWDGRYNYETYLGIDLLELTPEAGGVDAHRERDEWVGLLLADLWAFEVGARDGSHGWLPLMRPGSDLLVKRLHHLTTALSPVLARVGASRGTVGDVGAACRLLIGSATPARRRALLVSMQPVHTVHDEYLFIRTLQSFEVTFAAMAGDIRDAIQAVRAGHAGAAAASVLRCGATLEEARALFSLLATMQAESFRLFRTYTVGASAIQSRNYKTFEALCSFPSRSRIESPAYESVPKVVDRIQRDWVDLTSAMEDVASRGVVDPDELALVVKATRELDATHQRWKQTHWKLADRMIGDSGGTGYTVGVPYLKEVLDNRLFRRPEVNGPEAHSLSPLADPDLYLLLLIRRFEQSLLRLFSQGLLDGTTHTCLGQEYVPVALKPLLTPADFVFSNHRGHGHYLARFEDPVGLLAEIMGRTGAPCSGVGGSQHLHRDTYFSTGVQGESLPVAVGTAFHLLRQGSRAMALAYVGDGTLGQGAVYEALNMGRLWNVPLAMIVENNRIAQTTPVERHMAGSIQGRAAAFDIAYHRVTSQDVAAIRKELEPLLGRVRERGGPLVVEFETIRLGPHSKGDDTRDEELLQRLRQRDWCGLYERSYPTQFAAVDENARGAVEAAVAEVMSRKLASWSAAC
jgi:acetoin:2,6-dichlorophenolindophenol oxidoreductase subunit alpha